MKLLITGAAGFIGSHYVRTMLAGGYPGWDDTRITVLDSLTAPLLPNSPYAAWYRDHPAWWKPLKQDVTR